jgi:alpha-1,2-mannosyltransferase
MSSRVERFTPYAIAAGVVGVLAAAWVVTYVVAPHMGMFEDLFGRVANIRNLQRSGNIYVPFRVEAFTYPPGAILFFYPLAVVPLNDLAYLWTLLSIAALVVALALVLRRIFALTPRASAALAIWIGLVSIVVFPPVTECLAWGQTATILLLAVVLDALCVTGSSKGVLVGLATALKVYPGAIIILWMVRREWRAASTAVVSGAAPTLAAWVIWPSSMQEFVKTMLLGHKELSHFAGGATVRASSSLASFFSRAPFHVGFLSTGAELLVCVIVLAVALWGSHHLWLGGFALSSMVVALLGSVIATPVAWDHYFSFVPLLLVIPFEIGFADIFGRACVGAALVMMAPWYRLRRPTPGSLWATVWTFTSRNALLLASLAVLATALGSTLQRRQAAQRQPVFTASREIVDS